jgi:ketosteroid isomerase-like protein
VSDLRPVEQAVTDYGKAWAARDARALAAAWDEAGPVFLLAREHRQPLLDRPAIVAYLDAICAGARSITCEPDQIIARVLDPDTASAFCVVRWSLHEQAAPKPIGGVLKTTTVFKLRGAAWRLVHWAEASYAPYRFFTEYFEHTAEAGFAGQPRRTALP